MATLTYCLELVPQSDLNLSSRIWSTLWFPPPGTPNVLLVGLPSIPPNTCD